MRGIAGVLIGCRGRPSRGRCVIKTPIAAGRRLAYSRTERTIRIREDRNTVGEEAGWMKVRRMRTSGCSYGSRSSGSAGMGGKRTSVMTPLHGAVLPLEQRRFPLDPQIRRRPLRFVAFAVVALLLGATPAYGNSYSIGYLDGVVQVGTYAEWHSNYLWMDAARLDEGNFLQNGLWALSGDPCGSSWVETGVTRGFQGDHNYQWFIAWNRPSTGYGEYSDGKTGWDGSNHSYHIHYIGDGTYEVYRDGAWRFQGINYGFGTCRSDVGLESSLDPSVSFEAHWFDSTPLWWQDTTRVWHYGWSGTYYRTHPCWEGGRVPPNCYNGHYPSTAHWAANKPQA